MNSNYKRILFTLVFLLLISLLWQSIHRYFDHDEFEHIHSAWYIANGFIPYVDFFQHHHPLLWFIILPFFKLFGSSIELVLATRILVFIFTIGIFVLVHRITLKLTYSDEVSLIAVLLLLSVVLFSRKIIEVRPDVPQVFFGLLSVYFFLKYLEDYSSSAMIYAGLCASLSFLFLQKTIFLLLAYTIVFGLLFILKKINLRSLLLFAGSCSLPLILFLLYIIFFNSFDDYLLTNWLVNMNTVRIFSSFKYLEKSLKVNYFFWMLSVFSSIYLLFNRKTELPIKIISFLALFLLGSVFSVPNPYEQYFLFTITLLSIIGAYGFTTINSKINFSWKFRVLLLILVIALPVYKISSRIQKTNLKQLEKIDFVIKNTTDSDTVYDGNITFNLFRQDIHYFWFYIGENGGLDTYNKLTNNRYGDFNLCFLIRSKRPKIISNFMINMNECGLDELYSKTDHGLFLKTDLTVKDY
jgi:4-amino-4-deoxy-L-arabinose transferase-like glycosyltransferase